MKNFLKYYIAFFKVGLFTIGGGYAMLPIIEKEIVEKKKWVSSDEVFNSYALAQSIPGIIAVNASTLLGYKIGGIIAAIATCLGVISPSIIIIMIIAKFYSKFSDISLVQGAFQGIKLAVVALLISTIVKMVKKYVKDVTGVILVLITLISLMFFNVSPIIIIVVGAIVSILIYNKRGNEN